MHGNDGLGYGVLAIDVKTVRDEYWLITA
jgi:hypothetical protein